MSIVNVVPYYGTGTATSSFVWQRWVDTTPITTVNTVWPFWCSTPTSTATTVWYSWQNSCTGQSTPASNYEQWQEQRIALLKEREEQRLAMMARVDEMEKIRAKKVQDAHNRAERLLLEILNPDQREDYKKFGAFNVVSLRGNRYRVNKYRNANVQALDQAGNVLYRLCAHPGEFIPDCDTMLAQKLLLECSDGEVLFLEKANRHRA